MRPLKVIAITTDGKKPLAEGKLAGDQQPGRHDQRDYSAEGGVR